MNKSIFMGRLVRDPEVRYCQTQKGELAVATFRIAVERKFVREDRVKTDFITCSAFGRLAEFVEQYLLQGLKVIVTGRMENDNYTRQDGTKVYSMRLMAEDVEFAESKKAMEERMAAEDQDADGEEAPRSSRSGKAGRQSPAPAKKAAPKGTKRSQRDEEDAYEEETEDYEESGYDEEEDEPKRPVGRRDSARTRGSGKSSSGTRRAGNGNAKKPASSAKSASGRSRAIDEEYMEMEDEELDFD